ncbi:glucose dehydrogenase [FAD, quinone] isoform X2 [Harpegnathos saltator]|uniref:Glucose dehydrogenase [acceptor] n=1 Tax=Harpegnathos saltator TaxID=610380 RepID=E2BJJ9_HARSA|nr:glucose dehydrogenase [FAD, quinone] isoform X2 [Harpegnathos saltator]XP_025159042.1 glucose dehydrogenase [FAD, quinone] isoform X2 [Harpegnathos saltator]XP_025159043.1 glucose dehydrogenase [FAD, quinone] isoform X2 [Harpegnathos saltator]XP_025159044.1 glucose dehydrogenase [FAD, quinone] isoform X2 [Harpegnathos saltator]XP_025159045.1 glucose dehydrogenase [FAD, quinone] isoform X2 [Harpegnathos saltator]EFN84156.1 Glucose dehydrogenase [acceptor] [Harpegnathos saltator]
MCWYVLLLALVQHAVASSLKEHQPSQEASTYGGGAGCCSSCQFKDTRYMERVCEGTSPFMTLIQNAISSRCDIADPCRRMGTDEVPSENEWYDFVIVGAGTAGSIIARRLSDNPWRKVLLIEAGPEEPTMTAIPGLAFNAVNTSLDWNFKTEPTSPHPTACLETDGVCTWPRGKMVAGTGGFHGMMYVRGHPEIYNRWARAGNPGWSYDEIVHYFERLENPADPTILSDKFRSVKESGPMNIQYYPHRPEFTDVLLNAASELGYRTSRLKEYSQTGFMVAPMTIENGMRSTTSRAYLRPVHDRRNLRVLINAQVTRILISDWEKRAYGVELVDKNGRKRMIKCGKEVILTAGAVGSPHILMNSGVGPEKDLNRLGIRVHQDLPVGENLHNHVSVAVPMSIRDNPYEVITIDAVNEYLEKKMGPLASTGITQVTAFLESSYATNGMPDIQVFFDGFSSTCPKTGLPNECNGRIANCPTRRNIVARPTVVYAESRGDMKLRSSDPMDPPLIYPNYFTNEKDLTVLLEGIKKVVKLVDTSTMKKWDLRLEQVRSPLCQDFHFGTDAFWKCQIRAETGPENHQSGTCKMGPGTDPTAVVDSELRVHGIPNIRVADASIFPIVPNSNPIAGIMMVAEKAADMINNSWPLQS